MKLENIHQPRLMFKESGQGLFEFLVAVTFLLVPFVLGLSYLSRIGDLKHKTFEAARYASWERTVWSDVDSPYNFKSTQEINQEIAKRVFGHPLLVVDSVNDRQLTEISELPLDPYLRSWGVHFGPRANLIVPINESELHSLNVQKSQLGLATDIPGFSAAERVLNNYLDLDENSGLFNSRLSVSAFKEESWWREWTSALGSEAAPFIIETNDVILVGSWNSNTPEEVTNTVRRLTVAATVLDKIGSGLDQFREIPLLDYFVPELTHLDLGTIAPEIIPCQRTSKLEAESDDLEHDCVSTDPQDPGRLGR